MSSSRRDFFKKVIGTGAVVAGLPACAPDIDPSPVLDVPKWTVYLAIPVGAALESLLMILTWNHDIPAAAAESTGRIL